MFSKIYDRKNLLFLFPPKAKLFVDKRGEEWWEIFDHVRPTQLNHNLLNLWLTEFWKALLLLILLRLIEDKRLEDKIQNFGNVNFTLDLRFNHYFLLNLAFRRKLKKFLLIIFWTQIFYMPEYLDLTNMEWWLLDHKTILLYTVHTDFCLILLIDYRGIYLIIELKAYQPKIQSKL